MLQVLCLIYIIKTIVIMKLIYIIYWGAYSWDWYINKISEKIVFPPLRYLLKLLYRISPTAQKNIKKRGQTIDEFLDDSCKKVRNLSYMDITGSTAYYVKNWRIIFGLFFLFNSILICKRLIGGYFLEKYFTSKYAMPVVCILILISSVFDSFLDKKIGGKKNIDRFQKSPAREKIKMLLIYIGCFVLLIIEHYILVSKWSWFVNLF